jgi:hypothetical protein
MLSDLDTAAAIVRARRQVATVRSDRKIGRHLLRMRAED